MLAQEKRTKLVFELTQTAFSVNPNQLRQKFHELLAKYLGPPAEDEDIAQRLRDLFAQGVDHVSTEAILAALRSEKAPAELP